MAFFDKIGETISSKSKGVAQKAKDLAEVSDLNKQINQCNQKINDSYMEIGYYYYQAHKDDGDDPYAAQCANIRQAMDQAEALRTQIQVIKGVKVCPNCHAEIPRDSQFCGYCGCRITPQGQAVPQNAAPFVQADGQPGYGQPQATGYGQPAPEYGQPQAPGYEQPAPEYGQPQPSGYQQPAAGADQVPPAPGYEAADTCPGRGENASAPGEFSEYGQTAPAGGGEEQRPVFEEPSPAYVGEEPPAASFGQPQSAAQPELSPSVCPGCGSPVEEEDVFCGECGRKLK